MSCYARNCRCGAEGATGTPTSEIAVQGKSTAENANLPDTSVNKDHPHMRIAAGGRLVRRVCAITARLNR